MGNILPNQAGLIVNGIVYQYTTLKEAEDAFKVIIENENVSGDGFIFRNVDDWSGLPGATLRSSKPIDNIPYELWGNGSLRTEGVGEIQDTSVQYSYRYDTCVEPLSDPNCPGYTDALMKQLDDYGILGNEPDVDPAYWVEYFQQVQYLIEVNEEIPQEEPEEEEEKEEITLEDALSITGAAEKIADAESQRAMLQALTFNANMSSYYAATISGGVYEDTVQLNDKVLPDNGRAALRMGLANDVKHNALVDLQYGN